MTEIKKIAQLSDVKFQFKDGDIREFWGQVFIAAMDIGAAVSATVSIADGAAKAMTDRTNWEQDETRAILEEMYELFEDSEVLDHADNNGLRERIQIALWGDADE